MSFTNYPGNSNVAKQQQQAAQANAPQVDKVVDGYSVKKSRAELFKEAFLPQDWAKAAVAGFTNTIVPGIKNIMLQSLIATFTGMLYGGTGNSVPPGNFTPYNGMYTGGYGQIRPLGQTAPMQQQVMTPPKRPEISQVTLPAGQMEIVRANLINYASQYTWASMGVFYDLIGITAIFTDRQLGWTEAELQTSTITYSHVDNGVQMFRLNLPPAKPRPTT